jgi:hypothetical protein
MPNSCLALSTRFTSGVDRTKEHGMALRGFGVSGEKCGLVRMEPAATEQGERMSTMVGNTGIAASTYLSRNSRAIKDRCWYLVAKTRLLPRIQLGGQSLRGVWRPSAGSPSVQCLMMSRHDSLFRRRFPLGPRTGTSGMTRPAVGRLGGRESLACDDASVWATHGVSARPMPSRVV